MCRLAGEDRRAVAAGLQMGSHYGGGRSIAHAGQGFTGGSFQGVSVAPRAKLANCRLLCKLHLHKAPDTQQLVSPTCELEQLRVFLYGARRLMSCRLDTLSAAISFSHAHAQVSMERTIGTVSGGLLGLGISLLGHGFGQDSDMVFTGAVSLLVKWLLRPSAGAFLESSWQLQAASSTTSASFNCSSGICPHSCDAEVECLHGPGAQASPSLWQVLGGLHRCSQAAYICRTVLQAAYIKCKAAYHARTCLRRGGGFCGGLHSCHCGMGAVPGLQRKAVHHDLCAGHHGL